MKTERLLKLTSLIEANCEYVTVLRKCITDEQKGLKQNYPKLQDYIQKKSGLRINEQSFLQTFIQLAYFIFSCRRYNIRPVIGQDDIRVEENTFRGGPNVYEIKFCPIIWYSINEEDTFQNLQSIIIIRDIYRYLFAEFQKKVESNQNEINFKKFVMIFKKQCEFIYSDITIYQPNKQKQFFLCLEETFVFKQLSNLLKIKNNSILDQIKTNQANLNKFRQCKRKDTDTIIFYTNQKKRDRPDQQKIKEKQKQMEANVMTLFKQLSKNQTEKQQKMVIEGQSKNKTEGSGKQQQKVKITYKFKQKAPGNFFKSTRIILPALQQKVQQQPINDKYQQSEMQYIIEYSSDMNSICVKLIPNSIIVHIENSDFLMYQSNILTFQTVNVNIQLFEITKEGNKNTKKLAFKGTSCINAKQNPLQKILLLMDATMIAYKIYQPEFNIVKVMNSGMSDHQRLTLISNKINHYTRIFLKCAKKVYSE